MFVILFAVQLKPFVDKGPLWQQHVDNEKCGENWWTNLLYINNFYPTNIAADSVSLVSTLLLRKRPHINHCFAFFSSCCYLIHRIVSVVKVSCCSNTELLEKTI